MQKQSRADPRKGGGPRLSRWVRRCPTLPHPPGCSTIGAGGLSFRVRNETGRFPSAMTTETSVQRGEHQQPTTPESLRRSDPLRGRLSSGAPQGWGGCSFAVNHTVDAESIKYGVVKPSAY